MLKKKKLVGKESKKNTQDRPLIDNKVFSPMKPTILRLGQ